MAVKQVKEYYKEVEKLYFDLVHSLEEMQGEFAKGNITQEELNNALIPVNNIRDNYIRLAYVMHLLYEPKRKDKIQKYNKQNKALYNSFLNSRVNREADLKDSAYALQEFKKHLKELIKEKNNDAR